MKYYWLVILFVLLFLGGIIAIHIAILNSDLPDIWKWYLLK